MGNLVQSLLKQWSHYKKCQGPRDQFVFICLSW
jgi:hypothetical protein